MISKVECVLLTCDNCQEVFENYNGFSVFPLKTDVEEQAMDSEWIKEGEKHYCDKCYSYDDEDNLILKEVSNS
jgi:hypothetical protein